MMVRLKRIGFSLITLKNEIKVLNHEENDRVKVVI